MLRNNHSSLFFDIFYMVIFYLGASNFKFCDSSNNTKRCEITVIGLEKHPHYLFIGGGLTDSWKAGDGVEYGGSIIFLSPPPPPPSHPFLP